MNNATHLTDSDFLTEKRFQRTHSETLAAIKRLKIDKSVNTQLIEQIENEDILLKIKLSTYKKVNGKLL